MMIRIPESKIRVGVSSCLLGEKVRWNGDHKQDRFVKDLLGRFFEWVPTCPEMEVGMGVPRETVQLTGNPEAPRMVGNKTMRDHLRFSICYWHTFCADGGDPFGPGTRIHPWSESSDRLKAAEDRLDAAFGV